MTGESPRDREKDSRRRCLISSETTTSDALEQMPTLTRRALLLSLGCALLLALSATLTHAASGATSSKLSARLTATEFVASQVKSTRLVYKLPASKTSFAYRLKVKKGSSWQLVASGRKKGSSSSWKRIAIGKLFAGRKIKVGRYRVDVYTAGAGKTLPFRISPFCGRLTKKSFTISQAKSIKLIYGFSKPSKSFAYRLLVKKGSTWQTLRKAKTTKKTRSSYYVGGRTAKLRSLFGKNSFKLGTYRLRISSAYSTRQLNFKIVRSGAPATGGAGGSGSGSGSGSTANADFTISGAVGGLEPGLTLPVRLTLTNPHAFKIYVTRLTLSMSADSTPSGCSRDTNFTVTQSNASSTDPIAVPAKGTVTLTSAPRSPQITFLNLPTNQDVCKGKSFVLTFSGIAHS
jgi:hypothetical protein